jgi:hypothetical protein
MIRGLTILAFLFCHYQLAAQEFIGLRTGNYAGIHGIALNPATNVNAPKQWSINFFSMGLFFDNNYVFLQKANFPIAFLKANKLRPNPAIQLERDPIDNPLYFNYHDRSKQRYNFYTNNFVMGPGAMMNYKQHSFGIYTANKLHGYAHRIGTDYGYYYYQDSATTEMFLDPMKQGLLHYGELGFNYGTRVAMVGMADLNIGITVKYLMGWDGVFIRNNVRREAIKIDNGVKIPEGSDVDFNWSSNYWYDYVNEKANYSLRKNGNGVAFDIGLTLTNKQGCGWDDDRASNWRIGVAILDVGQLWFNKNSETNRFITQDTIVLRDEFYQNVKDLDSFRAVTSFHGFGTYDATLTGNSYAIRAPMSFTAFADFNITGSFFISANMIMRMPMRAIGLERANVVAITPRIEKADKEFAFPISFYNFTQPRVGFYVRKKFFFFGMDNASAWLVPQKLSGFDMYMGFKWDGNIFYKDENRNLNNRGKVLKCPVW